MEPIADNNNCFLFGSSSSDAVVPLKFVEVIPLPFRGSDNKLCNTTALSSAFVKIHLQKWTQNAALLPQRQDRSSMIIDDNNDATNPTNDVVRIQWTTPLPQQQGGEEDNNNNENDNHRFFELRSGFLVHQNKNYHHEKKTSPDEDNNDSNATTAKSSNRRSKNHKFPIVHLPSSDPVDSEPRPCWIIGHALRRRRNKRPLPSSSSSSSLLSSSASSSEVVILTDSTLVRILPQLREIPDYDDVLRNGGCGFGCARHLYRYMNNDFTGEIDSSSSSFGSSSSSSSSSLEDDELVHNHNPETIQELALRMSLLVAEPVTIGTMPNAAASKRRRKQQAHSIRQAIHGYCGVRSSSSSSLQAPPSSSLLPPPQRSKTTANTTTNVPSVIRQGALIVHSPHRGSGKTLLVRMIAKRHLDCDAVHVIQPGPLLAKYGVHADAALESILHAITMSAAATPPRGDKNKNTICIVLDHLDAMLPPRLSGRTSAGDAAVPVLNAIASYLKLLTLSLRRTKEFPFPSKNPLYNVGSHNSNNSSSGDLFPVRLCLVGIVTCPDDGGRTGGVATSNNTILNALSASRYRLPTLTAKTRLEAFRFSLKRHNIRLLPPSSLSENNNNTDGELAILAASAVWARGSVFSVVAEKLRARLLFLRNNSGGMYNKHDNNNNNGEVLLEATIQDIRTALASVARNNAGGGGGATGAAAAVVSFLASSNNNNDDPNVTTTTDDDDDDAFGSVGGNRDAKHGLDDALALDAKKRSMLAALGWSPPTGVLLYGPPGCGKTLLAKAVARMLRRGDNDSAASANIDIGGAFVSLDSSDVVRGTHGTSEKLVSAAFETARMNAPSVVFIDEFQALFTARDSGGSGKLSTTLLQCMDDVKRWRETPTADANDANNNNDVVVLGATNTPWMIDHAFLRPGRFDRLVHVGLPQLEERESILRVHLRNMNTRHSETNTMCKTIAQNTKGFSGADLAALCRAAAVRCLMTTTTSTTNDDESKAEGSSLPIVEERHFLEELDNGRFRPSSNEALVRRNLTWQP